MNEEDLQELNSYLVIEHLMELVKLEAQTPIAMRGIVSLWRKSSLFPIDCVVRSVNEHKDDAKILLLVSADSLASRYQYSVELQRAIERHRATTVKTLAEDASARAAHDSDSYLTQWMRHHARMAPQHAFAHQV